MVTVRDKNANALVHALLLLVWTSLLSPMGLEAEELLHRVMALLSQCEQWSRAHFRVMVVAVNGCHSSMTHAQGLLVRLQLQLPRSLRLPSTLASVHQDVLKREPSASSQYTVHLVH